MIGIYLLLQRWLRSRRLRTTHQYLPNCLAMHPNIESDSQSLGSTFLRTYWIFQAIFAGPISAALAISAFVRLLDLHGPLYDFVTQICTAILSAGIVFIVLVQRKLDKSYSSKSLTLKFEIAKSIFATALWVWCMLDAALGPESEFDYYKRPPRVGSAAVASIVLV